MTTRISRRQLDEIVSTLSERDKDILRSIRDYRYITTDQIRRVYFTASATLSSARRAATRNLNKLSALNLIGKLNRRIGGMMPGSSSTVWLLESSGEKLLRTIDNAARPRRHAFVPSTYFLAHTLAVAECHVQMIEICRHKGMKLMETRNEPDCWRQYSSGGGIIALKPDIFAVTRCGSYEDRWFFEIDLATESPVRITDKCKRYMDYYRSGLEQEQYGVFPLVVWIVPDEARQISIKQHIQAEFVGLPNIFEIITPGKLDTLIRQGADDMEGETR